MNSCLFCSIAAKEIPAKIVYEDEAVVAFLDIHPCAPGHTVVVPKHHAETILDAPDERISSIFTGVKRVTERLSQALRPDGFTIGMNHGEHAGQAIDHLHIHVIPRWQNDGGGSIHTVIKNPGEESLDAILEKIRKVR